MTAMLSPKDPAERITLTYDFSAVLGVSENITSVASVTVTPDGSDDSASSMIDGTPAISADMKSVAVGVKNGKLGFLYRITVTVDTSSSPHRYVLSAILPIASA